MEVMADCVLAKKYLVPFWRRNLVNKEVIADNEFYLPTDFLESELSPEVKALDLEDKLPISALIALRQYAAQEAVLEITHLRSTPKEMKHYIEDHHLDPNREGADNSKNKFWGLGKIAKLGKHKNELTELEGELLLQKKKKGLLKGIFKLGKSSKKTPTAEVSTHGVSSTSEPTSPGGPMDMVTSTHGMKVTELRMSDRPGQARARGLGQAQNYPSHGSLSGLSSPDASQRRRKTPRGEGYMSDGTGTDGDSDLDDLHLGADLELEHAFDDIAGEHEHDGEGHDGELDAEHADIAVDDDEKLMEELQAALIKSSLDADQAFTQRIKIATSVTLKVNFAAQTIVVVSMNLRFCQEKRRGLTRFIVELDRLSIKDAVSVKPIFKYIVSTDKNQVNATVLRRASILQTNGSVVIPPIEFNKNDKVEPVSEGGAQFNLLFEKKKGDNVEKGNSALFIKTAPLQVVWNELCIRQLLLCFASKSSASDMDLFIQSAAERNKLLSQGIKKFKAELSAPSYKVIFTCTLFFKFSVLLYLWSYWRSSRLKMIDGGFSILLMDISIFHFT